MSPKVSSKQQKPSRHSDSRTHWSNWEWDETYHRYSRYREVSEGKWEWEYAPPSAGRPHDNYDKPYQEPDNQGMDLKPRTPPESSADAPTTFDNRRCKDQHENVPQIDPSAHYGAGSGGSGDVYDITQGLADIKIDSRSEARCYLEKLHYSGDVSNSNLRGAQAAEYHNLYHRDSQPEPRKAQQAQYPTTYTGTGQSYYPPPIQNSPTVRYIYTSSLHCQHEALDPIFKVHKSREFKFGRVFNIMWPEPMSTGGTEVTFEAKDGERVRHRYRRFLVVKNGDGRSVCIPILTYEHRGLQKPGVVSGDHAAVYTSKNGRPYLLDGEKKLEMKQPIRIELECPSHKLDPCSRLNYAKLYTVEHNVKVLFLGRVAKEQEHLVAATFFNMHPLLNRSSSQDTCKPTSHNHDFSHAQQADPSSSTALRRGAVVASVAVSALVVKHWC